MSRRTWEDVVQDWMSDTTRKSFIDRRHPLINLNVSTAGYDMYHDDLFTTLNILERRNNIRMDMYKNAKIDINGILYDFRIDEVIQNSDEPGVQVSGYAFLRETFYADNKPYYSIKKGSIVPKPRKWIFNGPATIAIWEDGTKTVVKIMEGDTYDPEKAVAMCYMKKMLGTSEARKARKKAMKAYEEQVLGLTGSKKKAPEPDMDPEEKKMLEAITILEKEIKRRGQNIENRNM